MSHFAKIEAGIVTQVIVAEQDFIDTQSGQYVQTSYNTRGNQHSLGGTPMRGNFAGIGYVYDESLDVFYEPQPFISWTLNATTLVWEPPISHPNDGQMYVWDEPSAKWVQPS
jgi:hypothetical protein